MTGGGAHIPPPAQDVLLGLCRREEEFERKYDVSTWRWLGEGRFGCVGRIRDRDLGRDVALKLFWRVDAELRARIQAEVQNAQRIRGEQAIHVHTVHFGKHVAWLQMEIVDGENLEIMLDRRARENDPLRLGEALDCAQDAAEAVVLAHAAGVIHRDIKPSNFLLPRDGKPFVKLGDFGISKHHDAALLTHTGDFAGTPAYAAPELFDGVPADTASDVYSLAVVVYRILTNGSHPHDLGPCPSTMEILRRHRLGEPRPIRQLNPAIPGALGETIDRALGRRREHRPDAAALRDALRVARASPRAAAAANAPRHPSGRAILVKVAATAAVVTFSGGLARQPVGTEPAPSVPAPTTAAPSPDARAAAEIDVNTPAVNETSEPRAARRERRTDTSATKAPAQARATEAAAPGPVPSPTPGPAAPISPAATAVEVPEPGTGTLSLLIVPTAEVEVDGVSLGALNTRQLALSAGKHMVRILHPDYKPLPRTVNIQPGVQSRLVIDLSEKGIRRPNAHARR